MSMDSLPVSYGNMLPVGVAGIGGDPKVIEREARQHLEPIQGVDAVGVRATALMLEPWV